MRAHPFRGCGDPGCTECVECSGTLDQHLLNDVTRAAFDREVGPTDEDEETS